MDKILLLKVCSKTGNVQGDDNYNYHLPSNFNLRYVQDDNSFRAYSDAVQNDNTSKVVRYQVNNCKCDSKLTVSSSNCLENVRDFINPNIQPSAL